MNKVIRAISTFSPSSNFINSYIHSSDALIIDDGATCNKKAFIASLDIARAIKRKRKILIFSGIIDLGQESSIIHKQLAIQAHQVYDYVIYLGTEGLEEFKKIFKSRLISNQSKAINFLLKLDRQDLVIIEGKIFQHILNILI